MERIIFILWLTLCTSPISANKYKILFVNDANMKFSNGENIHVGDVFSDIKDIAWTKEKQAVKAIDLSTKKQILFTGIAWFKAWGPRALQANIPLSAHGVNKETFNDNDYYLLDSVFINTDRDLSKENYFKASFKYNGTKISKVLPHQEQTIILDKSLFFIDGTEQKPQDIEMTIEYVEGATEKVSFVKVINLYVFPEAL